MGTVAVGREGVSAWTGWFVSIVSVYVHRIYHVPYVIQFSILPLYLQSYGALNYNTSGQNQVIFSIDVVLVACPILLRKTFLFSFLPFNVEHPPSFQPRTGHTL